MQRLRSGGGDTHNNSGTSWVRRFSCVSPWRKGGHMGRGKGPQNTKKKGAITSFQIRHKPIYSRRKSSGKCACVILPNTHRGQRGRSQVVLKKISSGGAVRVGRAAGVKGNGLDNNIETVAMKTNRRSSSTRVDTAIPRGTTE